VTKDKPDVRFQTPSSNSPQVIFSEAALTLSPRDERLNLPRVDPIRDVPNRAVLEDRAGTVRASCRKQGNRS
jgi:hypothetical protein